MQDGEKHRDMTSKYARVRDCEMIGSKQEIHVTPLTEKLRKFMEEGTVRAKGREQYFLYTTGQLHTKQL